MRPMVYGPCSSLAHANTKDKAVNRPIIKNEIMNTSPLNACLFVISILIHLNSANVRR
jgi:hypothetical protein